MDQRLNTVSIYDVDPERLREAGFIDIAKQVREMRERGARGILKVISIPEERPESYYFGTYLGVGHHMFDMNLSHIQYRYSTFYPYPVPWRKVDGGLQPKNNGAFEVEGVAALHHKNGWTALAFANRTDDKRQGSNSVFFFHARFDFDQAVFAARSYFPDIVNRFAFEIVRAERYVIR